MDYREVIDKYWDVIEYIYTSPKVDYVAIGSISGRVWETVLHEVGIMHDNYRINRDLYEKHKILREIPLYKAIYSVETNG